MNSYYIILDNYYYLGENEKECYAKQDFDKSGWQPKESYIPKILLEKIKKGYRLPNNIRIIECEINLKYHIDYILKLQKYKLFIFDEMIIKKKN